MMKKLIILAGLLVSLQVNAQNYAKQWCAETMVMVLIPIQSSTQTFLTLTLSVWGIPIIMYLPQCSISLVRQS